jgi:hypothetical protein
MSKHAEETVADDDADDQKRKPRARFQPPIRYTLLSSRSIIICVIVMEL